VTASVVVAFADGGYFSETWGWTTAAFALLAAITLLVRDRIELGRLDVWVVGALTAFVTWVALSAAWSSVPDASIAEARRGLVYLAALLALVLLVDRRRVAPILAGIATGVTVVAGYSLGARLLASEPIERDPLEAALLIDPLGYANALGILVAIGIVLSSGFAVHGRTRPARALGAAAPMVLLPALVLTGSRGAWLALVVGCCVWTLRESRRVRLLATALMLAPPALVVVWITARTSVLTDGGAKLDTVSNAGSRYALAVVCLAVASALATLGARRAEAVLSRRRLPSGAPAILVLAVLGVVLLVLVSQTSLGTRGQYWPVAMNEYRENPVPGSAAGTFAQYSERAALSDQPLDAHSIYIEVLAELGPIGLALLLPVLGLPLIAAARARGPSLVGAATGAYVAYLVHAGLDWDWEMPAVTLAALYCASALLASGRPRDDPTAIGPFARIGLLLASVAIAATALTGQLAAN